MPSPTISFRQSCFFFVFFFFFFFAMERKKLHYFTSLNYKFRITNSRWDPCKLMVGNRTVASYQNGGLILSLEARKIRAR
jgi:hypothetical protein